MSLVLQQDTFFFERVISLALSFINLNHSQQSLVQKRSYFFSFCYDLIEYALTVFSIWHPGRSGQDRQVINLSRV